MDLGIVPDIRRRILFGNKRHDVFAVLHLQTLKARWCRYLSTCCCTRVLACVGCIRAYVRRRACECVHTCMQARLYLGFEFKSKSFKLRSNILKSAVEKNSGCKEMRKRSLISCNGTSKWAVKELFGTFVTTFSSSLSSFWRLQHNRMRGMRVAQHQD